MPSYDKRDYSDLPKLGKKLKTTSIESGLAPHGKLPESNSSDD
jgi:hypothetical protein